MFKVSELLEATGGKLVCGKADARVKGISIDSRGIQRDEAFVAIKGANFDGHSFIRQSVKRGASCVIMKKGAAIKGISVIKVGDTTKALGDIASFNRRRFNIPVIAVTGSNGKTTTKEMTASVLSAKFKVLKNEGTQNNHIGLPLALLKLDKTYDVAVLEIGTNHFGEVKYLADIAQPNIGVITNIGESHLESFKNLKGVFREKYNLVRSLRNPAIAVLNADDSFMKRQVYKGSEKPLFIGVGIKNKAEFCASRIRFSQGMPRFKVNQRFGFALNALGYYNIYNSLLAIAIGRIFGLEYKDIRKSLSSFNLPRGRLNFKYINKVEFIDDTYNANPLSLRQALKVLADLKTRKRKILVLGDMLELGEKAKDLHEQAIKDGLNSCDLLLAVGRMMSDCALKFVKKTDKLISCENSAQAAKILFEDICAGPEDIVLVKGSRGMNMEEVFNI